MINECFSEAPESYCWVCVDVVFLPFIFKLVIKYYTSSHRVHDGPYSARLLGYHSIGQGGGVLSVQTEQHLYLK